MSHRIDSDMLAHFAEGRERLLKAIRAVEIEPSLLGLGPHLMVIGRPEG